MATWMARMLFGGGSQRKAPEATEAAEPGRDSEDDVLQVGCLSELAELAEVSPRPSSARWSWGREVEFARVSDHRVELSVMDEQRPRSWSGPRTGSSKNAPLEFRPSAFDEEDFCPSARSTSPTLVEEPEVDDLMVVTVEDGGDEAPAAEASSLAEKRPRAAGALFRARGPSRALQERMARAARRTSEAEAARLEALRSAQNRDLETATRLGAAEFGREDAEVAPAARRDDSPTKKKLLGRIPSFRAARGLSSPRDNKQGVSGGKKVAEKKTEEERPNFAKHRISPSVGGRDRSANSVFFSPSASKERQAAEKKNNSAGPPKISASPRNRTNDPPEKRPVSTAVATGTVRGMIQNYEDMVARAVREAEEAERALSNLGADDARAQRRRRRADELRARQAAIDRNAAAKPAFTNVSSSPLRLVLRADCETRGADLMVSVDGGKSWKSYDGDIDVPRIVDDGDATSLPTRNGKVVVVAYARKDGMARSDVATAVFDARLPRFVKHAAYEKELERWQPPTGDPRRHKTVTCSLCATTCDWRRAYVARDDSDEVVFALCAECALSPMRALDPRPQSTGLPSLDQEPASPRTQSVRASVRASARASGGRDNATVAVDAGGKRLWLSENVLFQGNTATVMPRSFHLLQALADVMLRHPCLCVRLEGHANTTCGLECDGSALCHNSKCADSFGKAGGALAFSKARADAVKEWIVAAGVEDDRVSTLGLGGSRRVVADTEASDNHLNRRVEVHTVDA